LPLRVLLSCGEPSGDLYAGALTHALRTLDPGIAVFGLGGPQLEEAGGEVIADYRGLAATGLTEVIRVVPRFFSTLATLARAAEVRRPDVVVAIDFPEFNFRLARRMKALGVPVVYYIPPQVWAWRRRRLQTIKAFADLVLPIFPFEEPMYRDEGIPARFVGHPLVDLAHASAPREAFLPAHGLAAGAPTVALLPGSRPNEVRRILPGLIDAAGLVAARVPGAQFVVARAPRLDDGLFEGCEAARARGLALTAVEGDTDAVLASADVALVASGTATVQAALHDTPMVVVYRLSPLTYRLGRPFVKVTTFGMVNLIAGSTVAPELIQDAFTPRAVADEATRVLTDAAQRTRIREGLAQVRQRLGGPGATARAARAVVDLVAERRR
jgi:lipid-A-disaccharide synthase